MIKRNILPAILLVAMTTTAGAQVASTDVREAAYEAVSTQYLRLVGDPMHTALYFDIDRVWNYNLYEHSRWGGGLRLAMNNMGRTVSSLTTDAYLGYGTYDKRWKWGVRVDARLAGTHGSHLYATYLNDLVATASRSLDAYQLTNINYNSSFMTSRFNRVHRATIGWQYSPFKPLTLNLEARLSREQSLFYYTPQQSGLLYPDGSFQPEAELAEARLLIRHTSGWSGEALFGLSTDSKYLYSRILTQYSHRRRHQHLATDLFLQSGLNLSATEGTPYSRMFDLGGSSPCALLFYRTLLTATPNEFTSNAFLLASLRVATSRPLFNLFSDLLQLGSRPSPFVQLTAAWGHLFGQDEHGCLAVGADGTPYNGMPLQSPYLGIVEPTLGIDGLIRWGITEWGVAVAYRLTPTAATYHRSGRDNLALLFTAQLAL